MTVRVWLKDVTEPLEITCGYWKVTEQGHLMFRYSTGIMYVNFSHWTRVEGPTEAQLSNRLPL